MDERMAPSNKEEIARVMKIFRRFKTEIGENKIHLWPAYLHSELSKNYRRMLRPIKEVS